MTRDVVIVGGGIAGLSAAWHLRHRDVLLLEAGDRLGGRLRSGVSGDYWLQHGAHLFPAPGSLVDGFARECGLGTVPVTGGMMGLALGSKILDRGRVETYPFRLPLSLRERLAFVRAGVRIQRAVARLNRLERRFDFEDDRTFGEFLGPLPPNVHRIFACAAHRATAELDELSAGCGVGLFALVWGGKGSLIARNLLGGSGQLPAAMARELGDRARTGSRVDAIEEDGAALVVRAGGEEIRARQVIVAAQAPYAAPLVAPVAERAAAALERITYGAFLTVAVETAETTAMPYDDVYAMATPGRVFDMFTNQAHALRGDGPRRPGGRPVSCLKDTGGDATAATELIQTDGPTLLNGWDTLTFAAMAAGVRAVVWGTASIVPEQCVELHRLLIDDIDLPAARELWARLWPLCRFLEGQSYSAAAKTACGLVGDTTGPVRAPLLPLDADVTRELAALVEHATLSPAPR